MGKYDRRTEVSIIDTLLIGGDHSVDSRGIPISISGERELIQRALLRLSVKKGSFILDNSLGSDLYKLRDVRGGDINRMAQSYAQEALLPMSAEVMVESVSVEPKYPDILNLLINLSTAKNQYQLEVNIA